MTTATATRKLEAFQEYADNRGQALRVDREAGVIRGVKLLGRESKRGREYPPATMAKALHLYEGAKVNVDHVPPGTTRSYRDRLGVIRNAQLKEDGIFADFHFNPKHALAEQIAWDAEHAPEKLGFSHDTRGSSSSRGGKVVVESIDSVVSVDLVANPATTSSLFESADGSNLADVAAADQAGEKLNAICKAATQRIASEATMGNAASRKAALLRLLGEWQAAIEAVDVGAETKESADHGAPLAARIARFTGERVPASALQEEQPAEPAGKVDPLAKVRRFM